MPGPARRPHSMFPPPELDLNRLSLPELYAAFNRTGLIARLVELARDEDLGVGGEPGDVTSRAAIADHARGEFRLVARAPGVVSGLAMVPAIFELMAPGAEVRPRFRDGDRVAAGDVLAEIAGPVRGVVAAERTALNVVGRLSGVATRAAEFVAAAGAAGAGRVFDTRKTTPGLRLPEKYAARCGGAMCHRIGLHDAVLLKDNHLAGLDDEGVRLAVIEAAKARGAGRVRFVEIEVESIDALDRVLRLPAGAVDLALLDNMPVPLLAEAVARRDRARSSIRLEASGGVTTGTIAAIAGTGVDRISVGAITHHAVSLDVALDAAGPPGDRERPA